MEQEEPLELSDVERIKIDRTFDRFQRLNYYEVLDIPMSASRAQVKRAYYTVSKEFHPDRYFRRQLGTYKERLEYIFDKITKAYNTLSEDQLRADYDKRLIEITAADTPPVYEVMMEVGMDYSPPPTSGNAARRAEQKPEAGGRGEGSVAAGSAQSSSAPAKPVFLQKLQNQIMGRMLKAKAAFKEGKEAYDKGQFGAAVGHFRMALTYEPSLREAKELLEISTAKVADTRAETYYQRGVQDLTLGNTDSALRFLKAAVDCKPRKGHYYFKLASVIIENEKDKRGVVEYLKKGVEYDSTNVEGRLMLAQVYEDINMPLNAKREYEMVLRIDRNNQQAKKSATRLKAVS